MSRIIVQSAQYVSPREARSRFSIASLNTTAVRVTVLCSIAILGAAYLGVMNSSTAAGFELSKLEKHRVALETEYTRLQEQEVALRSLDHVAAESQELEMVAQTHATYVDRAQHQVAVR